MRNVNISAGLPCILCVRCQTPDKLFLQVRAERIKDLQALRAVVEPLPDSIQRQQLLQDIKACTIDYLELTGVPSSNPEVIMLLSMTLTLCQDTCVLCRC